MQITLSHSNCILMLVDWAWELFLYQTQDDGTDRVIAYASRTLSKSERNYPAYKLEFLALKWSVCDRFHEYLYGGNFEVFTDNNPSNLHSDHCKA